MKMRYINIKKYKVYPLTERFVVKCRIKQCYWKKHVKCQVVESKMALYKSSETKNRIPEAFIWRECNKLVT